MAITIAIIWITRHVTRGETYRSIFSSNSSPLSPKAYHARYITVRPAAIISVILAPLPWLENGFVSPLLALLYNRKLKNVDNIRRFTTAFFAAITPKNFENGWYCSPIRALSSPLNGKLCGVSQTAKQKKIIMFMYLI